MNFCSSLSWKLIFVVYQRVRQGRVGSNWRHIKQTNNYSNANLLFIDGTVRINDSSRFPPNVYGYPPRLATSVKAPPNLKCHSSYNLASSDQSSFNQQMVEPFLSSEYVRNRPLNLSAYANRFHEKARLGYEYWPKERKYGENTKTKCKKYLRFI